MKTPCLDQGPFPVFHSLNRAEGNTCNHKSLFRTESMTWSFWVKMYTVFNELAPVSNTRGLFVSFEPSLGKQGHRDPGAGTSWSEGGRGAGSGCDQGTWE